MKNKKTLVINLFGGPGSGKSTLAANLFGEMKAKGYNVELAREWVKRWAYEGKPMMYKDQVIVFGNQVDEETAMYNKVDILITDSPLILSPFYEQVNYGTNNLLEAAKLIMKNAQLDGVTYWNLLVKRQWPYQTEGRFQTEEQANDVEKEVVKFLKTNKITYETVNNVEDIMLEMIQ